MMQLTEREILTLTLSAIAIIVSIISGYYAYLSQRLSWRFVTIERQYDAFIEFSQLRLDNWQLSHLFETPENYPSAKAKVRAAFEATAHGNPHEVLLKERACAAIIFTHYESTLYQLAAARDFGDRGRIKFLEEVLNYLTSSLLKNPRLLYLWCPSGGNLQAFFEASTRDHYDGHVTGQRQQQMHESFDVRSPFEDSTHDQEMAH